MAKTEEVVVKKRGRQGRQARPIAWEVDEKGCWICTSHGRDAKGYPHATIDGKGWKLSRYMHTKHNGDIPKGLSVLHSCDTPECINPSHLSVGTHQNNMDDKKAKGRQAHITRKLTEELVEKMLINEEKLTIVEQAEKYGIHHTMVEKIRMGWCWGYVRERLMAQGLFKPNTRNKRKKVSV